jgi:hypothetical protein
MTEVAAPIEWVRPDPRPPIAPAQAAALQEACAAAAAIHSALEFGVIARLTETPADPAAVAAACGLTEQGAEALLSALAGLDLLELGDDGCFRPASSGLADFAELLRPWVSLPFALRGERRPAVLYALGLVLRTGSGRIYPYSNFRRRLGEGGFDDVRRRDLPGPFRFTLITGERR